MADSANKWWQSLGRSWFAMALAVLVLLAIPGFLLFGLMWALLSGIIARAAAWSWVVLGVVLFLRILVSLVVGKAVLKDRQLLRQLWLLPLRDLIAVGVWIASFWSHTVTWRGDRFELRKGRLFRIP